jgi:hypothetical protein
MNEQSMLKLIGGLLILVGLLWIWKGDKEIPVKGGKILRLLSYPQGQMRWIKWLMGGGLIYAGLAILFK